MLESFDAEAKGEEDAVVPMTDVVKEEVLVAFSVEEILDDADEVAETETACWGCD